MADPITLGVGALVGGTVLQGVGSIMGGEANAANLQTQQNAANYNAALYNQQAQQASATAVANANQQQVQARAAQGNQRAAIAESGGGFSGSNALLINQSANNAEFDRENILYQGILQNQSDKAQAVQSTYAGQVAGSQINSALDAGYMGAGTSLLSGLGTAMLTGYKRKVGYLPSNPYQ